MQKLDKMNDKRKKIGIVSCYHILNYGSILQAYATQRMLDDLDIECETINVAGFLKSIRFKQYMYIIKSISSGLLYDRLGKAKNAFVKNFFYNSYCKNINIRETMMSEFVRNNIRKSYECHSLQELSERIKSDYYSVLIGSDQLWLPANIAAGYYTLEFVPTGVNKIAYATSFGIDKMPHNIETQTRLFLSDFTSLSTREESGQSIIEMLTGRRVPVVCDPTLLFDENDWMKIQKRTQLIKDDYILCYFIGKKKECREFACRLKEYLGIRIVALTHVDYYMKNDEGYADETPYDIGPGDFISLIRDAKYICTDSYHCIIFSLIYNKSFFAFNRYNEDSKVSTNSRVDSLLKRCGVEERIVDGTEKIEECCKREIDYSIINENIKSFKIESLNYLKNALEIV